MIYYTVCWNTSHNIEEQRNNIYATLGNVESRVAELNNHFETRQAQYVVATKTTVDLVTGVGTVQTIFHKYRDPKPVQQLNPNKRVKK